MFGPFLSTSTAAGNLKRNFSTSIFPLRCCSCERDSIPWFAKRLPESLVSAISRSDEPGQRRRAGGETLGEGVRLSPPSIVGVLFVRPSIIQVLLTANLQNKLPADTSAPESPSPEILHLLCTGIPASAAPYARLHSRGDVPRR